MISQPKPKCFWQQYTSAFVVSLMTVVVTSNASYSAEGGCAELEIRGVQKGSRVHFTLTNTSPNAIKVRRDFSHWQNLYFVVIHESGFGTVVPRRGYGTDPVVGDYSIPKAESVEEHFDLISAYPSLLKLDGYALLFWSTNVYSQSEGQECKQRHSGSIRIALPIH